MKPTSAEQRTFHGRTVVLTGAGSGLGRALALRLAAAGAVVHALDLNREALATLSAEASGPGEIRAEVLDVLDLDHYRQLVDAIRKEGRGVDFLFNNAGITLLGEAHKLRFGQWRQVIDVNLMGVINGIQTVYPLMIANGGGHIINTASIAGLSGYATAAAYTASKAAIIELSRSLRAEARAYGVRVSNACPGYVNSGIFAQERIVGASRADVIDDLPVRMMSPEEAAERLLRGVVARKRDIIFPLSARVLWTLSGWAPRLVTPFQRRFIAVFRKT